MTDRLFDSLKLYTGFTEEDSARLAQVTLSPEVLTEIIERFYGAVLAEPETAALVPTPDVVGRLKGTLTNWIQTFFAGPHDQAYFQKRRNIGRRHVEINLAHHYVLSAMALLREDLVVALREAGHGEATLATMHKLIDIELAIMMETYQEERLRLEMLRESERVYRDLIEHAPEMILTINRSGEIRHINRTALSQLGYTLEQPPRSLTQLVLPEDIGWIWQRLTRGYATEELEEFETRFLTALGEPRTVEVRVAGLARFAEDVEMIRVFVRDVTEARVLESKLVAYRKQAEEKRRLATIGQMVAGIAHEIRTPLQVITTGVDALSRAVDDRDLERETARTREGLRQIREFIQEILDYSKEVTLDRMAVDPATLIASVEADLAEDLARTSIRLERRFEPEVGRLDGDPFRLKQVFLNLVKNAIEAAPEGSSIHVAVAEIDNMIAIDVRDEGRGISPEDRERIFVPFFTTKPRGTGLGLAIVRRIIDAHGGRIAVGDATGAGTSIRVLIPCAPSQPVDAR